MKLVLARFDLTELDELTALICDLESGAVLLRVEDDGDTATRFDIRVKEIAAANGYEVQEWDRSALRAQ
jgi:hypothetical protein